MDPGRIVLPGISLEDLLTQANKIIKKQQDGKAI
jgi:hypothetical protein